MQIRRFSPDIKTKVPGGHPGLYAVPIQVDTSQMAKETLENLDAYAQRLNGLPILLNTPLQVVAMYFEPQATLDEHSADHPILFLVIGGEGMVRIGGREGETQKVRAGDAVLWPTNLDHTVWTEESTLQAITIEAPPERSA